MIKYIWVFFLEQVKFRVFLKNKHASKMLILLSLDPELSSSVVDLFLMYWGRPYLNTLILQQVEASYSICVSRVGPFCHTERDFKKQKLSSILRWTCGGFVLQLALCLEVMLKILAKHVKSSLLSPLGTTSWSYGRSQRAEHLRRLEPCLDI